MNTNNQMSPQGIEFLKRLEGCSLTAYWDHKGYSIGYGHQDPSIKKGDKITLEQADQYLKEDLQEFCNALNSYALPLNTHQYDALICFIYNIGASGFRTSTLLKELKDNVNSLPKLEYQWKRWKYAKDKDGVSVVNPGLEDRRNKEWRLYANNDYDLS